MAISNLRKILDPIRFMRELTEQGLKIESIGLGFLVPEQNADPAQGGSQVYVDFEAGGKKYRVQAFPHNLTLTEKLPDPPAADG
jgi:hypothetical protein